MKVLKFALFAGAAALASTGLLAQATPTPPPQSPAQQEGAPSVPGLVTMPPQQAAPPPQTIAAPPPAAAPRGPANICRELVAFVEGQARALSAPARPAEAVADAG